MIDFSRPVGVLMVAVLQHLTDGDDPAGTVARYRDAVPAGSHLVISHPAAAEAGQATQTAEGPVGSGEHVARLAGRTRGQIAAMFACWELLEPGVTAGDQWRPDPNDPAINDLGRRAPLAGVARKP